VLFGLSVSVQWLFKISYVFPFPYLHRLSVVCGRSSFSSLSASASCSLYREMISTLCYCIILAAGRKKTATALLRSDLRLPFTMLLSIHISSSLPFRFRFLESSLVRIKVFRNARYPRLSTVDTLALLHVSILVPTPCYQLLPLRPPT
jgi:hypothetical protein